MDITQIILDQHNEQRRLFGFIQEIDRDDTQSLEAVWKRLSGFLEAHAEGEEQHFYPQLIREGSGAADATSADDETRDAIKDHNKIRDAITAADRHSVGSDAWFEAVTRADVENSKHMGEEERQALADFRSNASLEQRHRLGVQFVAFVSRHYMGVKPVDKDPDLYIEEHREEAEPA